MTPGERLALLKKEQGSLAKVMAHENDTTYMIYTDDGDIVYKSTKLPVEGTIGENYLAKFKSIDCKMIDENKKGMGQFSIEKDEHDVCHIVLKTYEIDKGTYEIPSMDKAMRSEYSQQFFSNTNVIKAHDDFESKKNQYVI